MPKIQEASLQELHPTQLTVGFIVVRDKKKHLAAMSASVYRSLAGYVRDAHGYDKTPTAFAEFIWADFFRRNIPVETVRADFVTAVRAGVSLGPE